MVETGGGRWRLRRMLGSPHPTDHLDSTYTCLNNPENRLKTSRIDSSEPSIDKRPTEEGKNACYTEWQEGAGAMEGQLTGQDRAPKVWLAKAEWPDSVSSDSQRDLTSGML